MAKFRETFITQEATSPQRSVLCSSKIRAMIPSPGRVVISSDMLRLVATLSLYIYIYIYIIYSIISINFNILHYLAIHWGLWGVLNLKDVSRGSKLRLEVADPEGLRS